MRMTLISERPYKPRYVQMGAEGATTHALQGGRVQSSLPLEQGWHALPAGADESHYIGERVQFGFYLGYPYPTCPYHLSAESHSTSSH
ncbi:MAG: hypothetical protein U0003_03280 [Vampirovibrionales bacterium]